MYHNEYLNKINPIIYFYEENKKDFIIFLLSSLKRIIELILLKNKNIFKCFKLKMCHWYYLIILILFILKIKIFYYFKSSNLF